MKTIQMHGVLAERRCNMMQLGMALHDAFVKSKGWNLETKNAKPSWSLFVAGCATQDTLKNHLCKSCLHETHNNLR